MRHSGAWSTGSRTDSMVFVKNRYGARHSGVLPIPQWPLHDSWCNSLQQRNPHPTPTLSGGTQHSTQPTKASLVWHQEQKQACFGPELHLSLQIWELDVKHATSDTKPTTWTTNYQQRTSIPVQVCMLRLFHIQRAQLCCHSGQIHRIVKKGEGGATGLVKMLSEVFVTYSITDKLWSDGGPQYAAEETDIPKELGAW